MSKLIEWSSIFEISPKIDEQHQKLCDILNELHDFYINNTKTYKISKTLQELQEYTIYHFNTEEELFRKHKYSKALEHIKEHRFFIAKIDKFIEQYKKNDSMLTYDMLEFLKDWIISHILNSDKEYKKEIYKK
ncbi:MAG: bacteriohemerythrin [Bacteroidota bacterium]|nr:bacteriohemerythrin [Bacteroidota bacterium]